MTYKSAQDLGFPPINPKMHWEIRSAAKDGYPQYDKLCLMVKSTCIAWEFITKDLPPEEYASRLLRKAERLQRAGSPETTPEPRSDIYGVYR